MPPETVPDYEGVPLDPDSIWDAVYSEDGKRVFVLAWGGSGWVVWLVDRVRHRGTWVGFSDQILPIGECHPSCSARDNCINPKLRDHLLSRTYKFDLGGGRRYFWALLDAEGRERGEVGASLRNVSRFLAKECGQGKVPPWEPPQVPPLFQRASFRCGEAVVSKQVTPLLDGTARWEWIWSYQDEFGTSEISRQVQDSQIIMQDHCPSLIPSTGGAP